MTETQRRPGGRSAEKRAAMLRGGLVVFARDGYSRAGIDAIAREAGVSTRTIYNHYVDKAELFAAVIVASADRVAEAQIAVVDAHFDRSEPDLSGFARAWATPDPEFVDHFALVRQIRAEVGHVPAEALKAWLDAGPRRVQTTVATRLAQLAARGFLHLDDPQRAAGHLIDLVATETTRRTFNGALSIPQAEIDASADAGLAVFLRAYRP